MLGDFLTAGGGLHVIRRCVWCHSDQTTPEVIVQSVSAAVAENPALLEAPPPAPSSASVGDSRIDGLQIATEVVDAEYGNCRWDVAALEESGLGDGSSSVVAAVEVYVTHRAVRPDMPWRTWAEVEASQILDALDRDGLFPSAQDPNFRRDDPVIVLRDMRLRSAEKCDECAWRKRVAGELGYLVPYGRWTNRMRGNLDRFIMNRLWDELRERSGCCIRCGEAHPLGWAFARPYCRSCYSDVMEPDETCRMCFQKFQFLQPREAHVPENPDSGVAIATEYGGLYAEFCLDKRRPGEQHMCRDCFVDAARCRECQVKLPMSHGYGGATDPTCARCAEARARGWPGFGHCLICDQSLATDAPSENFAPPEAPARRKRCRAKATEDTAAAERQRQHQRREDFLHGYDPLMHHARCWRTQHPVIPTPLPMPAHFSSGGYRIATKRRRTAAGSRPGLIVTGAWDRRFV